MIAMQRDKVGDPILQCPFCGKQPVYHSEIHSVTCCIPKATMHIDFWRKRAMQIPNKYHPERCGLHHEFVRACTCGIEPEELQPSASLDTKARGDGE